jgi:hypothetical protein
MRILYAIHSHPRARNYVSCSYNCYFFAQAIVFCTARSVMMQHKTYAGDVKFPFSGDYWKDITLDEDVGRSINKEFVPIGVHSSKSIGQDSELERYIVLMHVCSL